MHIVDNFCDVVWFDTGRFPNFFQALIQMTQWKWSNPDEYCQIPHITKENLSFNHDDVIALKLFPRHLALCEGNPVVTSGFPSQRPVTRNFDVFLEKGVTLAADATWWQEIIYCIWASNSHCSFEISLFADSLLRFECLQPFITDREGPQYPEGSNQ